MRFDFDRMMQNRHVVGGTEVDHSGSGEALTGCRLPLAVFCRASIVSIFPIVVSTFASRMLKSVSLTVTPLVCAGWLSASRTGCTGDGAENVATVVDLESASFCQGLHCIGDPLFPGFVLALAVHEADSWEFLNIGSLKWTPWGRSLKSSLQT